MKNIDMLLKNVNPVNHFSIFGHNKVIVESALLSGAEIYFLFEHIKWMEEHNIKFKTTICFRFNAFKSSDVINVLELLFLYIGLKNPNQFTIQFDTIKTLSKNLLFKNSLLSLYNQKTINRNYVKQFYEDIYTPTHYRHVVICDNHDSSDFCVIGDNIKLTISNNGVDYELAIESAESTIEMIENVVEHSLSDCIVDVKVCKNINGRVYISLNVVALSNIFIGTKLLEFINDGYSNYSGSEIVNQAFQNHKKLFGCDYDELSFSFVCSFQNTVSTRNDRINSGGTGFTTLLKNIHNKSFNEEYASYILSGNNTLYFKNKYLTTDCNGIIGFNDENDFYNKKPNPDILKKEIITFPGTIFCVNLITEYKKT